MSNDNVRAMVEKAIRLKDIFTDISADDDFFDQGASSLTVVNLQYEIEKAIGVEVETSQLLATPSINGWGNLYTERQLLPTHTKLETTHE